MPLFKPCSLYLEQVPLASWLVPQFEQTQTVRYRPNFVKRQFKASGNSIFTHWFYFRTMYWFLIFWIILIILVNTFWGYVVSIYFCYMPTWKCSGISRRIYILVVLIQLQTDLSWFYSKASLWNDFDFVSVLLPQHLFIFP